MEKKNLKNILKNFYFAGLMAAVISPIFIVPTGLYFLTWPTIRSLKKQKSFIDSTYQVRYDSLERLGLANLNLLEKDSTYIFKYDSIGKLYKNKLDSLEKDYLKQVERFK